jgi:hypothetical protein
MWIRSSALSSFIRNATRPPWSWRRTVQQVASPTQHQALSAIAFLYREILGREMGWIDHIERAKQPERLPVIYLRAETRAVLAHLEVSTG